MNRYLLAILSLLYIGTAAMPAHAQLTSFPGAQGFGTTTVGGRGGQVLKVTNTNDSGPGSPRAAVETSGPRYVVFETGGIINLQSQLTVRHPNLTIAGQTSTGDGIVLKGWRLSIQANDVIVRALRFRPGDGTGQDPDSRDGIAIGKKGSLVQRVIIDHCSVSWSIDENMSTWYPTRDITFSNNLSGEALVEAGHSQGTHSMGLLIGDNATRVTIAKNLFAHNNARHPLVKDNSSQIEIINNYVYNYGTEATTVNSDTSNHIIKNFYREGVNSLNRPPVYLKPGSASWLKGNIGFYRESNDLPESDIAHGTSTGIGTISTAPLFTPSGVDELNASNVLDYLVENVGAMWPQRDLSDERIIDTVLNRTGQLIDRVGEVGGYPSYASGFAQNDTDNDGMPDWFEIQFGLDNNLADHNEDNDSDGYTNIEEYFNGLISGFDLPGNNDGNVRELVPQDDAFVRGTTSTNYGDERTLRIKKSSGAQYNRSAYVKFDISSLYNIVSAQLKLTAVALGSDVGSVNINQQIAVVADNSWSEETINEDTAPSAAASSIASWQVNDSDLGQVYEIDITQAVKAATAAGQSAISLQIRGVENLSGAQDIYYGSKEQSEISARPVLEVVSE